jgi:hypothetical protein
VSFIFLFFSLSLAVDIDLFSHMNSHLSRRIFLKILNEALVSDTVYITCRSNRQSQPAYIFGGYATGVPCVSDRSGPQDLKACVEDDDTCYLYSWKEPLKFSPLVSHSSKPEGINTWRAEPFKIDPSVSYLYPRPAGGSNLQH